MTGTGCFKCGGSHMARECTWTAELEPATARKCRTCRTPGAACAKHPCAQCGVPVEHHTEAGTTECAWRGQPCGNCGKPPHPDWHADRAASYVHPSDADIPAARLHLLPGPDRCERYTHPDDTPGRRAIRARTPWRRMADPDTFYKGPKARPPAASTAVAIPAGTPPHMIHEPADLTRAGVPALAAALQDLRGQHPAPRGRSEAEQAALRDLAARQAAQSRQLPHPLRPLQPRERSLDPAMGYETTLARHEAEQADRNWQSHRRHCPRCDAARARRRWDELCRQGTGLHVIKRNADAELKRNRELDKLPIPAPDQEALF